MTIPDLLHAALAEGTGRPLVTFYDEASGERTELSVATMANWVSKTGNLLQDSLGAETGTTVRVALPVHWEACVWLLASWSVGCVVTLDAETPTDVAVVGPGGWDTATHVDGVVALSLRPLGARFDVALPKGVIDYNAEVAGHGDHFTPHQPPSDETPALQRPSDLVSHGRLVEETRGRVPDGARMLLVADTAPERQAEALVTALAADGSLVLARDPGDAGLARTRLTELAETERVTMELC